MQPGLAGPPAVRFLAGCGRRLRSHAGVCPCGVSPHAAGRGQACSLPPRWVPWSTSSFPAVPCCLLYHLPQQRRDAAAHGHDIIRRRTRVRHSRVPACRSGGCPAVHVSGTQPSRKADFPGCRVTADSSCPGRVCRTAAGGRSGPPAFLHSSLTLHQSLMMVRQGRF